MTTAVDTNALLALLYGDEHADESEAALRRAYRQSRLVATPVVFAELAADGHFDSAADLTQFLADFSIAIEEPSHDARFRAGEAFRRYVDRRPDGLQCPACGARQSVECERCGSGLTPRQHVAADFLIGGHAATDADALVSFDGAFYGSSFPGLAVHPE